MKPTYYYDEMYRQNFWFFIGWAEDKLVKYLKRKFDYERDFSTCDGAAIEFANGSDNVIVIWVRKKNDYSSLAHECLHAANFMLHRRGWKPDLDNDEPQTYMLGHLMRKALE